MKFAWFSCPPAEDDGAIAMDTESAGEEEQRDIDGEEAD